MKLTNFFGASTLAFVASAAFGMAHAADLAPAPAPAKNNSISLEFSPEWKTSNGIWADYYFKLGFSHTFDSNIVWGAAYQHTFRDTNSADQLESSLGYKFKTGVLTLTPSVLLGYGFGDQPRIDPDRKAHV